MWKVNGDKLQMAKGDYGISLPVTVTGASFGAHDSLKFTFVRPQNSYVVLEKEFSNIEQNTANLEFTAEESALFRSGTYAYSLDWYQDGNFMCNIIPRASFEVVDKA